MIYKLFFVLWILTITLYINRANAKEWKFLTKDDHVDIVWPSASPSPEILVDGKIKDEFCQKLDQTVKEYGLNGVDLHEGSIAPENSWGTYYANSDLKRTEAFIELLDNPKTCAIWCGRGGFGTSEVLEILEGRYFCPYDRILPIIGFSDITYLHLWASRNKWPSLHAPVANFNQETYTMTGSPVNNKTSIRQLIEILKGDVKEVTYDLKVLNPEIFKELPNDIETKVLGGNFSVVQRSSGTPTALKGDNAVVFLEDTAPGESFYRFMSLFTSLSRSGLFDKAKALFLGQLSISGMPLEEVVRCMSVSLIEKRGIHMPILYSPNFGHGSINSVLPFGTSTKLIFTQDGNVVLRASANKSAY